ncbi:MAG: hypothetical protein OXF06_07520 [Bacteroidetes bacterium]|nr:hypothetical protein [Bacteroidota bacterium]
MKYSLSIGLIGYWALSVIPPVGAQNLLSNMNVFENLGIACMDFIPSKVDSLILDPPDELPYVTTTLIKHWQEHDMTLFYADSLHSSRQPFRLSWQMSNASISYTRERRRTLSRSAKLALRYTFLDPTGKIIAQDSCNESFTDTISERIVSQIESEIYPETQGDLPPKGWVRHHLEPIIIAAATALTAFLFFNLRNDSTDS